MNNEEWRKLKAENGGPHFVFNSYPPEPWAKESWEKAEKLGLTKHMNAPTIGNIVGNCCVQNIFWVLDQLGLLGQAEGKE